MAGGYGVDVEGLGSLIDDLATAAQRITDANSALRDASPSDLGHAELDGAGRDFQDRWEHGTGKIAEGSETMVEALQQTQRHYAAVEGEISRLFAMGSGAVTPPADPSSGISAALGGAG